MSIASEAAPLPDSPSIDATSEPPPAVGVRTLASSVQLRVGTNRSNGTHWAGFTDPFSKTSSVVVASVMEIDGNNNPVKGAAPIRVMNLIPGNGRIDVMVAVDWDSALSWRIEFVICN
ncbi:hypothetical protein OG427_39280 [Streptomyces sp. NBC_00133]|uniref:hypothetical protein n=1 Tax=Streptomyces sp. NBC_00133 TaxID=2903624 RepID=UPI003254B8B5